MSDMTDPFTQITLDYTAAGVRSRVFTDEEDRFLLLATARAGYGRWDDVKRAVRQAWQFQCDWFLRSRTAQEIGRRVDTLLRALEKRQADEDEARKRDAAERRKRELAERRRSAESRKREAAKKREEADRESLTLRERLKRRRAELAKLEREARGSDVHSEFFERGDKKKK